jgi:hypothetical protein
MASAGLSFNVIITNARSILLVVMRNKNQSPELLPPNVNNEKRNLPSPHQFAKMD